MQRRTECISIIYKHNGNCKSIKYRYSEHNSSVALGEPEGGCSCDS